MLNTNELFPGQEEEEDGEAGLSAKELEEEKKRAKELQAKYVKLTKTKYSK